MHVHTHIGTHTHIQIYFKKLADVIVGAGKPKIHTEASRLGTQEGVAVAVGLTSAVPVSV
jgi:hypothetical protein